LTDIATLSIADQKTLAKEFATQFCDETTTAVADVQTFIVNTFDGVQDAVNDYVGPKGEHIGDYIREAIDQITDDVVGAYEMLESVMIKGAKEKFMESLHQVLDDWTTAGTLTAEQAWDQVVLLIQQALPQLKKLAGRAISSILGAII
jgi:hypothetical protein